MIISPSLALSALAFNLSTSPSKSTRLRNDISPILCYDSRYAITRLHPDDCRNVIRHKIVLTPFNERHMNFSRHPNEGEFPLPHTWSTRLSTCAIVIDIPDTPFRPTEREESSLGEVKAAAFQVLAACVARGSQLGGIAATGKEWGLQVRVEARGRGGQGERVVE
ncbi:MAG: hypothetical protein LQ346_000894 [Caloplaca aetnensis]|nr:MAG: hypothetical protein LQ346_000894 [Caloplaca aetnensis]